jgi:T5SS/PEP-CTERM-associated repeat protein
MRKNIARRHSREVSSPLSLPSAVCAVLIVLLVGAVAPRPLLAQDLHIDNNTTVTAAAGTTVQGTVVAGFNSGTVNGVPGGTYIVPTGANVVLSGLFAGFAAGSSGLIVVNGGNISTTNPQSQYFIGFNGSGELVVSNGGTVTSDFLTFVGTNAGSSGVLTVEGQGSRYTNNGSMMVVGNGGPGQLNVLDGGAVAVTATTLQIGAAVPVRRLSAARAAVFPRGPSLA